MDCSTPGLPVHHQLLEFTQTHVSSSVVPFSSHLPSFPASGSFPMNQFFPSGGQTIGVLALASVLPMNMLICSKFWNGKVWVLLCSFSGLFWLFWSHKTLYDFYNYLVSFFKEASRDSDRSCVESVDQFGELPSWQYYLLLHEQNMRYLFIYLDFHFFQRCFVVFKE